MLFQNIKQNRAFLNYAKKFSAKRLAEPVGGELFLYRAECILPIVCRLGVKVCQQLNVIQQKTGIARTASAFRREIRRMIRDHLAEFVMLQELHKFSVVLMNGISQQLHFSAVYQPFAGRARLGSTGHHSRTASRKNALGDVLRIAAAKLRIAQEQEYRRSFPECTDLRTAFCS